MSATVSAFFYGSFMNPEVMAAGGHRLDRWQIACAIGFEFRIAPHATLARAPGRAAFGIVTPMTHSQLDAVYATQSRGTLYLPEPILVDDQQGGYRPAICYIAPRQDPGAIDPDYVRSITGPARQYGFPDWYVAHIESFLPG